MTELGAADDTPLCVTCAMCCDGTLFRRAKIYDGEVDEIRESGLEILEDENATFFRLPCRHNHCGACQIYDRRFHVCRTFFCALYKRQAAGEISMADARNVVATALSIRDRVTENEPRARMHIDRHAMRNELAERLATASPAERPAIGRQLIELISLDTYLDRHFRDGEEDGAAKAANS